MRALDVDLLVLSGHKMYAPYGAGALVGRAELLSEAEPLLRGGGAVRDVRLDDVDWADPPKRHEAGSPNSVGAVALGVACDTLAGIGMQQVAAHERQLAALLWEGLDAIGRVRRLRLWQDEDCDIWMLSSSASTRSLVQPS